MSALTDIAFQRMARGFNGPPVVLRAMQQILRLMAPVGCANQRFAGRMGLVAENWSAMAIAQQRYTGNVLGPRFSRLFADVVLRASGLSPWTQAGRWAFGLEFVGQLGDKIGTRIADMPAPTANALRRYGVTASDWRAVGHEFVTEHRGAGFLDLPRLSASRQDVADKLQQMVLSETD